MTAAAGGPTPPALRLPDGVKPLKYEIELTLNPASETYDGDVEIDLELAAATPVLWLNASDLTMQAVSLVDTTKTVRQGKVVATNEDFMGFQFDAPVGPGRVKFRARYQGQISPKEVEGVFKQKEGDDWYLFTHFEPFHARSAFPCFDEPGYKVPWQLTLTVPQNMMAVSNSSVDAETPGQNGMKVVKFKRTRPLPSYLIAFAVGPFEAVDAGPGGYGKVPVRIIVPKGKSAQAAYAAQVTPELLGQLEKYFGLQYPYDKLDTVAVPLFGGAMENAGLITYSSNLLLAKPEEDSSERQRQMASVQAHEMAHMWFGDYVSIDWWDDTWLKESFSDWMSSKIVSKWKPEWKSDIGNITNRNRAMATDGLVASRPIHLDIQDKGDIVQAFDVGITYLKGDAVLSMLEGWVGAEQYRAGIKEYLKTYKDKNASAKDYFAAISTAAGKDVTPVFSTFIDQPGVPLVSVKLDCKGKAKLELSQKRYFPLGSKGGGDKPQTWQIPVCAAYGVGKDRVRECTLLTSATGELPLTQIEGCPDWVYPNDNQTGYYRGALAPEQLKAVLEHDALTVPEQVGLLGDLTALMTSGDLAAADVLRLVPKLAKSDSRHVVGAAALLVSQVKEDLVSDELRPNFQRFVNKSFGPKAKSLGMLAKKKEDDDQRLMRPTVLGLVADEGGDKKLQADAKKLAEKWLKDHSAVSPDMLEMVMSTAGRNADAALWNKLLAAAKAAKDRNDRAVIFTAMGSTKDPALVQKNLELVKSSEWDPRESFGLLFGAFQDPATRELAYTFLKGGWEQITASVPKAALPYFVRSASGFCDAAHRDDAEKFFKEKMAKVPGGAPALAKTLERIDLCVAVKEKQQASVASFLKGY